MIVPLRVLNAYLSVCYSRNEGHIQSGTLDLAPGLPTNLSLSYVSPLLLFFSHILFLVPCFVDYPSQLGTPFLLPLYKSSLK